MSQTMLRRSRRLNKESDNQPVPQWFFAAFTGDRSGSMSSLNNASADGLYEWVKTMKETAINNNQEGFISVTTFDNEAHNILNNVNVKNVDFTMERAIEEMDPRGSTRLYDTAVEDIKKLLKNVETFRNSLPNAVKKLNPKISVSWMCCTDGQDNESVNYSSDDFKRYVKKARKKGVKCFFIAANQNAIRTGNRYGFRPNESMSFSANRTNASNAFRSVSDNMRRVSTGSSNTPFTQTMRNASLDTNDLSYDTNDDDDLNYQNITRSRNLTLRQPPRIPRRLFRLGQTNYRM